jgi:hypothetical protein
MSASSATSVDPSHAREWGIAAVLIGLLAAVLVPVSLGAAAAGLGLTNMKWTQENFDAANRISFFANLCYSVVAAVGLLAAGRAIGVAMSRKLPAGLAVAGLVFAIIGVATVVAGWMIIAEVKRDAQRIMQERREWDERQANEWKASTRFGRPDTDRLE